MSDQHKNAQPSSSQKKRQNADGTDYVEKGEDRGEGQERFKQDDARRAGGGRQPESDKPSSPDGRSGSERKS